MLSVSEVSSEPLSIELKEAFGIASGTQHRADNVLVQVVLSDGSRGLGEAAPFPAVSGETQASALAAIELAGPDLIGECAAAWRPLCQRIQERLSDCPSAASALQSALLDAWLRSHRMSMWAFFGGAEPALHSDITIVTGTARAAEQASKAAWLAGFRELKVKVGAGSVDADLQRLRAIARAAPDAGLVLDANGAFDADQALALLRGMGDARERVTVFEQPTAAADLAGLRQVMVDGRVAVAADESARSAADVRKLVRQRAVDAINIKLTKSGLTEALAMITLAQQYGLKLMIGGMVESQLAMSVSACVAAGRGGFRWVDLDTPLFMIDSPFRGGYLQDGSTLKVNAIEAGHGVERLQTP